MKSAALIRLGQLVSAGGAVLLMLPLPAGFGVAAMAVLGLGFAPVYPSMILSLIHIYLCGVAHEYHRGPACAGAGRQIERFRVCRGLKKPSVSCMIKGIFRMRYKHAGRENAMKIMAVDYGCLLYTSRCV